METNIYKEYELPEFLLPEFSYLDKRMDRSYKWVTDNQDKIDKKISFIQAIELHDFGIDVTQL